MVISNGKSMISFEVDINQKGCQFPDNNPITTLIKIMKLMSKTDKAVNKTPKSL